MSKSFTEIIHCYCNKKRIWIDYKILNEDKTIDNINNDFDNLDKKILLTDVFKNCVRRYNEDEEMGFTLDDLTVNVSLDFKWMIFDLYNYYKETKEEIFNDLDIGKLFNIVIDCIEVNPFTWIDTYNIIFDFYFKCKSDELLKDNKYIILYINDRYKNRINKTIEKYNKIEDTKEKEDFKKMIIERITTKKYPYLDDLTFWFIEC